MDRYFLFFKYNDCRNTINYEEQPVIYYLYALVFEKTARIIYKMLQVFTLWKSVSLNAFLFQPVNCSVVCLLSKFAKDIKTISWMVQWEKKKTEVTINQEGILMNEIGKDLVVKWWTQKNLETSKISAEIFCLILIGCGRVKWWLDSILFYPESFQLWINVLTKTSS